MANQFTVKRSSNIGTTLESVGSYTVPAGNGAVVVGLTVSNTSNAQVFSNVVINDGTNNYYLIKNATIAEEGTLVVVGNGQKIILQANDTVKVNSSSSNSVDAMLSIMETTDVGMTYIPTFPIAGATYTNGYPTINSGDEVFKFSYDTGTLPNVPDLSSHAWHDYSTLSFTDDAQLITGQPPVNNSGRHYYSTKTGTYSRGVLTLTSSNYQTYHNTYVATSSWTYETHVYLEDPDPFTGFTTDDAVYLFSGGAQILLYKNSYDTNWRISMTFFGQFNGGGAAQDLGEITGLTSGVWHHLVITTQSLGSNFYAIHVHVDGIRTKYQSSFNAGYGFYIDQRGLFPIFIGRAPTPTVRIDNTRLILGTPFGTSGTSFEPPTNPFAA
jgi:hypothetical protein